MRLLIGWCDTMTEKTINARAVFPNPLKEIITKKKIEYSKLKTVEEKTNFIAKEIGLL